MQTCNRCKRYKGFDVPKTNCTTCWNYYFKISPGRLTAIDTMMKEKGEQFIKTKLGDKLVKFYKSFKAGQ